MKNMKNFLKNHKKILVYTAVILTLICTSFSVMALANVNATGSFHGVIKDSDANTAISGVAVGLRNTDNELLQTVNTDDQGKFTFSGYATGAYLITIEADNYSASDKTDYHSSGYPDGYLIAIKDGVDSTFVKGGEVRYVTKVLGNCLLTKTDKDTGALLEGAIFELYNNENVKLDTYATNEDGEIITDQLDAGNYYFKEKTAPTGYVLDDQHKSFSITKNSTEPLLNVTNTKQTTPTGGDPIVTFNKYLTGTTERVIGAKLEIVQGTTIVDTFTTSNDSYDKALAPGEYTLKETHTPDGYFKAMNINFTVEANTNKIVTMYDASTKVTIFKLGEQADGSFANLAGASLKLQNTDDPSINYTWTSSDNGKVILGIPQGKYVLSELKAPAGYKIADPLNINVEYTTKNQEYSIKDMIDKTKTGSVSVLKVDAVSGSELEGAKLYITNKNNNVVDEWVSTNEAHITNNLIEGEYTLLEKEAPAKYFKFSPIKFNISSDSTSPVEILAKNDYTKLVVTKYDKLTDQILEGAKLRIEDENHEVVHEWTSKDKGEMIYGFAPGQYKLIEYKAPNGYKIADPMEFEVKETGDVQEISFYNTKINEAPTEPDTPIIEKIKTGDTFNLELYGILFAVAAIGAITLIIRKKK